MSQSDNNDIDSSTAGNNLFRSLIGQSQQVYMTAAKLDKAKIAMAIVKEIKSRGGRFLRVKRGNWMEITAEKTREKTSQALQTKVP